MEFRPTTERSKGGDDDNDDNDKHLSIKFINLEYWFCGHITYIYN